MIIYKFLDKYIILILSKVLRWSIVILWNIQPSILIFIVSVSIFQPFNFLAFLRCIIYLVIYYLFYSRFITYSGVRQQSLVWEKYTILHEPLLFNDVCIIERETYNICLGGAHGVTVIIVGNGHGDMNSNHGRDRLHFT